MTTATQVGKKEMKDAAEDKVRSLREVAKETGSNVRDFIGKKSEQAAELRKNAEHTISDNPMKSVALAALGGLVIGALLRRR